MAIGLANRVVPKDQVLSASKTLAARMVKMSPLILKVLKRTLNDGGEMPLTAALAHEQAMASIVFDSEDAHEGCAAFLEKTRGEVHRALSKPWHRQARIW